MTDDSTQTPDLTLRAFTEPRPDRATRFTAGQAARIETPLDAHAHLVLPPDRDALALLHAQESSREPGLIPLRYERMGASPFAFLRGSAAVMAADLSAGARTTIRAQLCGDAHVANFGMFASPDRRLVFDLNDFDETLPGPFEWDVKRLAASVAVAGRHVGVKPKKIRAATRATVASYRTTIAALAQKSPMEVWYTRVDVEDLVKALKGTSLADDAKRAGRSSAKATGDVAVGKLTEVVDGRRRFRSAPPLLVPVDEAEHAGITEDAAALFGKYLETLSPDAVLLLLRYSFVGLAHKVVGVGSVGTRALAMLMVTGDGDHLVLQIKQANASVLEPYVGASSIGHHGRRVVVGQRLMQATGDPLLGWTSGSEAAPFDYFVRQIKDMKGSIDLERLDAEDLALYGRICGAVLARAHTRAGGASKITGYLGDTDTFDVAVAEWANAYADLTERDHAALIAEAGWTRHQLTPRPPERGPPMSQDTINPTSAEQAAWHLMPGAEVLARLNSTPTGLTDGRRRRTARRVRPEHAAAGGQALRPARRAGAAGGAHDPDAARRCCGQHRDRAGLHGGRRDRPGPAQRRDGHQPGAQGARQRGRAGQPPGTAGPGDARRQPHPPAGIRPGSRGHGAGGGRRHRARPTDASWSPRRSRRRSPP